MENISCIIVDDEPDAIALLKLCLNDLYPQINIVGSYSDWKSAFQALSTHTVDILFSDISMPERSGLDLLKLLPGIKSEIIFVTAHSEYALAAYKHLPTAYLLKPIVDGELVTAVNRAMERIKYKNIATQSAQESDHKIGIPNNKGIDYISVNSIIYLKSVNKCTKIVTTTKEYMSSFYMGKFRAILKNNFYQVHRSFIINLNAMVRYESSGVVIMSNKEEIPVARNEKDNFMKLFDIVSTTRAANEPF